MITQIQDHLSFVLVCLAITAVLFLGAKLLDRLFPRHRVSPTRRITIISVCAAIAAVLHILDFSLVFLAPEFYRLDFSELPVMLCGFFLGPSAAVACEAVKILLKLIFKSTSTAFVGDFANFAVGCSFALPAVCVYHLKKTRAGALWGLVAGTAVMTVFGSLFNAVYLLPRFAGLYGISMDSIIAMGTAIHPEINSVGSLVLWCVVPLNLIKGVSVSLLTMLLYKKVARPLFGNDR